MGKPEGKRSLGISRRSWEGNIKMNHQDMGCGDMDWINLARDREKCRALANAVIKLRVS